MMACSTVQGAEQQSMKLCIACLKSLKAMCTMPA